MLEYSRWSINAANVFSSTAARNDVIYNKVNITLRLW